MQNIATEVKKRLMALRHTEEQALEGASDDEILDLEAYAGGKLPTVYKQFLKALGRSAGELFQGTDYALGQRFNLRLREYAVGLLRRSNASFNLPPTAFVFLMTQGYQFAFFNIDQGDDPAVFRYLEGESTPIVLDATLSSYLMRCIEACEHQRRKAE